MDNLSNISKIFESTFSGSGRTATRESPRPTSQASSHFGAGAQPSDKRKRMRSLQNCTLPRDCLTFLHCVFEIEIFHRTGVARKRQPDNYEGLKAGKYFFDPQSPAYWKVWKQASLTMWATQADSRWRAFRSSTTRLALLSSTTSRKTCATNKSKRIWNLPS